MAPFSGLGFVMLFVAACDGISLQSNMITTRCRSDSGRYQVLNVTFDSDGAPIVGRLFVPDNLREPVPAFTIIGPFGFVKEQSPLQYASRLARAGYVALIFDPKGTGESGGNIRRLESPSGKRLCVRSSIDFLQGRPEVDGNRIGAIGICQGSSHMIAAASQDRRIRAMATVTGQYMYRDNMAAFYRRAGGPSLEERIARGREAKAKFERTGMVDYLPVVDPLRKDVALPHRPIFDWYNKWINGSRWENRYAVMSDAELLTFDVDTYAEVLQTPIIMIHGEMSDGGPESVRHVYQRIPGASKKMILMDAVAHLQFYEDPIVIDRAFSEILDWFDRYS